MTAQFVSFSGVDSEGQCEDRVCKNVITGTGTIGGTPSPDLIFGGDGCNVITDGGGTDSLDGGPGDANIRGNGHPDIINSGPGDENLRENGGSDIIDRGDGSKIIRGG